MLRCTEQIWRKGEAAVRPEPGTSSTLANVYGAGLHEKPHDSCRKPFKVSSFRFSPRAFISPAAKWPSQNAGMSCIQAAQLPDGMHRLGYAPKSNLNGGR